MTIEPAPTLVLPADPEQDIPNATIIDDGTRVTAAWVEDDDSDEYARTFECRHADGTVEFIPPECLELDTAPAPAPPA